jgi:hypothetical protein
MPLFSAGWPRQTRQHAPSPPAPAAALLSSGAPLLPAALAPLGVVLIPFGGGRLRHLVQQRDGEVAVCRRARDQQASRCTSSARCTSNLRFLRGPHQHTAADPRLQLFRWKHCGVSHELNFQHGSSGLVCWCRCLYCAPQEGALSPHQPLLPRCSSPSTLPDASHLLVHGPPQSTDP